MAVDFVKAYDSLDVPGGRASQGRRAPGPCLRMYRTVRAVRIGDAVGAIRWATSRVPLCHLVHGGLHGQVADPQGPPY